MSRATVIHLEQAVERKPLISRMKKLFPLLDIYPAKDGAQWQGNPKIAKAHPLTKMPVSQGAIGCAHSHIDLIHDALLKKESAIVILEDDCEFGDLSREELTSYIFRANTLGEPWDILLLGATEYTESDETSSANYKKVGRFWGTHALILRERGMRAALKAFHDAQKEGIFLLADWMYNRAIRQEGLTCFGPTDPSRFCKQKEGLVSYLTGQVRTY